MDDMPYNSTNQPTKETNKLTNKKRSVVSLDLINGRVVEISGNWCLYMQNPILH